jgi:hypothetical protein
MNPGSATCRDCCHNRGIVHAGCSMFFSLILCVPPQVRELYRILLEGDDWLRATCTLLLLAMSCGVISLTSQAVLVAIKSNSFLVRVGKVSLRDVYQSPVVRPSCLLPVLDYSQQLRTSLRCRSRVHQLREALHWLKSPASPVMLAPRPDIYMLPDS